MNGLEEIVLTIKQKADAQCDEIRKAAEQKAEAITDEARQNAEAEYEKTVNEANRKAERIIEAAKSAALSNRLKEILAFKSNTVAEVIKSTVAKLDNLGDKEYFEVIEKLIYANFHKNESGKLMFGERDNSRIPEGFSEKINQTLAADGASLKIGETADIKNGFVLSYGDIEENCCFDAIVSAKEDMLKDEIASILFS